MVAGADGDLGFGAMQHEENRPGHGVHPAKDGQKGEMTEGRDAATERRRQASQTGEVGRREGNHGQGMRHQTLRLQRHEMLAKLRGDVVNQGDEDKTRQRHQGAEERKSFQGLVVRVDWLDVI